MCTTDITIWTYNTHLFGDGFGKISGQALADPERKHSIIQYFQSPPANPTPLRAAAFEEVWDAGFAGDFASDLRKHGGYPSHYINDVHALDTLNLSGLALFGGPDLSFHDPEYVDYIVKCNVDGFALQDLPTGKGYLKVKCDFTCSAGHEHHLGLLCTHMPTNSGTYPKSIAACFQNLANKVGEFRQQSHHPDAAVILMGDLNISAGSTDYTTFVQDILLNGTGLLDTASGFTPGNTVDGDTNTFWRYFNQEKVRNNDIDQKRIDYVFAANSGDGTLQVSVKSIGVVVDPNLNVSGPSGYNPLSDSDHYPLQVVLTLTGQD